MSVASFFAFVLALAHACAPALVDAPRAPLAIVDAPMAWTAERAQLTLAYRRRHSDPRAADLAIAPRAIVLHYTAGSSAARTRAYFDNPRIEASRTALARAGAVNVSSHFVVDRDGTIYRLQPETRFARHAIGMNHVAIGIENVGDGDLRDPHAASPLTAAQVAADIALVRDLVARYPAITTLVGHSEIDAHAPLYLEREAGYVDDKPDPGAAFLAKVRAGLAELHLSR